MRLKLSSAPLNKLRVIHTELIKNKGTYTLTGTQIRMQILQTIVTTNDGEKAQEKKREGALRVLPITRVAYDLLHFP